MAEIRLEGIKHIYPGNVEAIKEATITFKDQTFNSLLGPSGCGKTTLMKIIAGLLKPTDGRVYFDGQDVTGKTPQERNVAMVFQFPVVYDMSVYDNLAFPLKVRGMPKQEIKRRVAEVAKLLELEGQLSLHPGRLDSGGKQRVAIGRALVRTPNAFILDEPFSNIDPESRLLLRSKLKEIQKDLKQTMVFVTHDQAEALTLADWIAVMRDGRIIQFDTPEQIYEEPADTFIAYFIGMPAMNLIDCSMVDGKLLLGELSYDISDMRNMLEPYGDEFYFGIRAEHIEVSREPKPEGQDWIPIMCEMVEGLGPLSLLHLKGKGLTMRVKTRETGISEGDTVWIKIRRDKVRIFKRTGERIV